MKDLIIFGAGPLGRLVHQIAYDIAPDSQAWNPIGFLDENTELHETEVDGLSVLGGLDWIEKHPKVEVIVAVASPAIKHKIVLAINALGHSSFATLVHPKTWLGNRVEIGVGSIIYPGVLIDPDVRIGNHVILNKNCTIGHNTFVEDFVTVAPGVNIGGGVIVGKGCEIGINSAIIQNLSIGHWSTVGAGAAVIKPLPPNITAVGVPAKPIKERPEGWQNETIDQVGY